MASDRASNVQTHDVRPETQVHNDVAAFANGHGPILSRADQTLALQSAHQGKDSAHLPSNEDLLQQLRVDARKFEHNAPRALAGLSSPSDYNEYSHAVREIVDTESAMQNSRDRVTHYTPQQLRDIGDLANAAHDPAKLHDVMQRFTDSDRLLALQDGLRLEQERRGGKTKIGVGIYSTEQGLIVPYVTVTDNKTGAGKTSDAPAHAPSGSDVRGFELNKS